MIEAIIGLFLMYLGAYILSFGTLLTGLGLGGLGIIFVLLGFYREWRSGKIWKK